MTSLLCPPLDTTAQQTDRRLTTTRVQWIRIITTICTYTGTAIKYPVSDQVKPSFVNFDIREL